MCALETFERKNMNLKWYVLRNSYCIRLLIVFHCSLKRFALESTKSTKICDYRKLLIDINMSDDFQKILSRTLSYIFLTEEW